MKSIDTLQKKKEIADNIVNHLIAQSSEIEKRVVKAEEYLAKVKITDKNYKGIVETLQKIHIHAKDSLNTFKVEKVRISKLLEQINDFYINKYVPLLEKINNKEDGFAVKIRSANTITTDIDKIHKNCSLQYDKIKVFASEFHETQKSLVKLDISIQKIFVSVQSNHAKSDDILKLIKTTSSQVERFKKDTSELKDKSINFEKQISSIHDSCKLTYEEIVNIKTKSNELLSEILNIYEMAADTGRSGEFDKRRKVLTIELKMWHRYVFYSTVALLVIIISLFIFQLYLYGWDIKEIGTDLNFYFRFILASPVVFYITFASLQYDKTKKLVDKYSFKTTLAASIKPHLELLTSNPSFKEAYTKEILDFSLHAFNKIYSEPFSDDELKLKMRLKNIEIDLEKNVLNDIKKPIMEILNKMNDKDK